MFIDTNNSFKINRIKREPYFKMQHNHYHDTYEIYYLFSGTRKIFINDTIYRVKKGDMIIFKKGEIHRTTYDSNTTHERIYIYFPGIYLEELFKSYEKDDLNKCFLHPHISIPLVQRHYIEGLLEKLENEYKNKDRFSETLLKGYMNELMIFILRYQMYRDLTGTENIDDSDILMQKAARFVANNFKDNITLNTISKYVNLSDSYFSMKFKKSTGFGFKEYLLNVRIKKASELLLETKLSITDISYQCGFSDSNYFGDVFKKVKGLSPIKYRNNYTVN